jgi:hypothetical protein
VSVRRLFSITSIFIFCISISKLIVRLLLYEEKAFYLQNRSAAAVAVTAAGAPEQLNIVVLYYQLQRQ